MKTYVVIMMLLMLPLLLLAEFSAPGPQKTPLSSPQGKAYTANREVPAYTFTKLPTSIITNYYDYMIGAYNSLPLRVIPDAVGGGYFMAYHGRRQATATRRVFYTYMDAQGNVINNNEITSVQNHEGFIGIDVDPVSGKPMYAWHANADGAVDANLEVQFTSDAFIAGIAGLFDVITLMDAPTTITPPSGIASTDNEFIWPCVVIGPSPVANKRRVFVGARNYVSHALNGSPSENMYIAYADFNADDIENGVQLAWSYISIPDQDAWNHDTTNLRRPSGTLAADNAGNLFWAGHHLAWDAEENSIDEEDLDVWMCPNYGQGTWTRAIDYSKLQAWNPPDGPGSTTGYYTDPDNGDAPYTDEQMFFAISNSGHANAVVDASGKIHVPSIWALNTFNNYYYPALQFIKEFVYDPTTQEFEIREIYPQQDPDDDHNTCFIPWDIEAPWGEVDQYGGVAPDLFPAMVTAWPFPHWDQSAHTDLMMFHYNGIKLSEPNDQGMMVCVWQDSERARMINFYSDTDYSNFANTPEIWIAVSADNGNSWSEPIIINNVETAAFAGIKPMYTYPADKVIYTGMQGASKVGKLGIMFYNDYTWGSNVNAPPYHPTPDGGEVMFMELQIVFPPVIANDDNITPELSNLLLPNYPNPFNPETTISFDMPKSAHANLSIFNVKGQLVKTLANSEHGFGRHSYVWDGSDNAGNSVSSGMYFYRLTTNGNVENRKMMLLK